MSKSPWQLAIGILLVALTFASVAAVAPLGPPNGSVYVNGEIYATVTTPKELPNRGRFGTLYLIGDEFAPVANAAPGERGYHGGRWEVREITFDGLSPRQLTSEEQIFAWLDEGYLTIGEVDRRIQWPLIRR